MALTLEDYRQFYSEEIAAASALRSKALISAFAKVPRENFFEPGPWKVSAPDFGMPGAAPYRDTEDADPKRLYHNILIAIDPARRLNNGHPSALAAWLDALDIAPGDHVFHLGAGVGYYTAIIAEIVGPDGHVAAAEVDLGIAARARANLAPWKNVELISGDGGEYDPGPVDVIFINAGVTHPRSLWLDRLKPGGRLLFPITFDTGDGVGKGCMVLVKHDGDTYPARSASFVMIYSCTSVRDKELNGAILKQLSSGKLMGIKSLRRDAHESSESCLVHGADFCLSSS
jgi:protein-L-isoaspartate(D-aspartate) O-methyltransferase